MGISLKNVSYIYQAGTPFEGRALFDMTTTIKDGSYTALLDIQEVVNLLLCSS